MSRQKTINVRDTGIVDATTYDDPKELRKQLAELHQRVRAMHVARRDGLPIRWPAPTLTTMERIEVSELWDRYVK